MPVAVTPNVFMHRNIRHENKHNFFIPVFFTLLSQSLKEQFINVEAWNCIHFSNLRS